MTIQELRARGVTLMNMADYYTANQLAVILGVTVGTISRWARVYGIPRRRSEWREIEDKRGRQRWQRVWEYRLGDVVELTGQEDNRGVEGTNHEQ